MGRLEDAKVCQKLFVLYYTKELECFAIKNKWWSCDNVTQAYRKFLGLLPESDRNAAAICGGMVESRMRFQRAGRNMAGDSPFRKGFTFSFIPEVVSALTILHSPIFPFSGRTARPQFPWRLHKSRKCAERGQNFRSVSENLDILLWVYDNWQKLFESSWDPYIRLIRLCDWPRLHFEIVVIF